jgi:hypothetical protein
MIITLDLTLNEIADNPRHAPNLTTRILNKVKTPKDVKVIGFGHHECASHHTFVGHTEGFLASLAKSYSLHRSFAFGPHDLWFVAMSELAKLVNETPDVYRHLFTKSADKQDIIIPAGDPTSIDPIGLIAALLDYLPARPEGSLIDVVLPELSTSTPYSNVALAATFCDMVQSYYNYMTFCCGLPRIHVDGTKEDWQRLVHSSKTLSVCLGEDTKAGKYMAQLDAFFQRIHDELFTKELDVDFWKGIFTTKNMGSGGELQIQGWIRNLYSNTRSDWKLDNYTCSVGAIPFKNIDTGREFTVYHGAFIEVIDLDGFIRLDYGHLTIERNVKE